MLSNLSGSGCPTNLDNRRTRAYCACSRCGWELFGHFPLVYLIFLSLSLEGSPILTEILSQRTVKPKTAKFNRNWYEYKSL